MKTDILKTPLADIWIEDDNGNRVSFETVENTCRDHAVHLNNDKDQKVEVTNYKDCRICLDTGDLKIGKEYYVRSSEPLEYLDSDEWLFTYGIRKDDKTMAISFPQPNEEYMMHQTINRKEINKEEMEGYYFETDYDHGIIILRILDHKYKYIYIPVAWILDIRNNMDDYETAAACMTWDGLSWNDIFGQKNR